MKQIENLQEIGIGFRVILMGRAANIHIIMALQRPETSVDGAIRIIIQ